MIKPNQDDTTESAVKGRPNSSKFIVAVAALAAIACAAWFGTSGFRAPVPAAQILVAEVEPQVMRLSALDVVTAQLSVAEDVVKATSQIYPAQEAAISAQVSGVAESVSVRPGDLVKQGDLLGSIGTSDLQLQLDQQVSTVVSTQAQFNSALANLNRTQALADKGLTPQTTLDSARSEADRLKGTLATQQSQVELAKLNLQRALVMAPFSGAIASRNIEPGQMVSSGTPIFTVVDMSRVRVELLIALRDAPSVEIGQKVNLAVEGATGKTFGGVIDRINPIAEAGTRSVKAYLTLDNTDQLLRGGMVASANIIVRSQDAAMILPRKAVQSRDSSTYVFAVVDGKIVERPVRTGPIWGTDSIEISSGVAPDDVILRTALAGISSDTAVSIEGN